MIFFIFSAFLVGGLSDGGYSLHYLIASGGHQNTHQRADEIEEAERQVGQCGYTQDGGLRQAARVPGNQDGGDGDRIFGGAAQQAAFVALPLVDVAEHVAQQDDADVLVGRGNVQEEAREDRRGYGADTILDETHAYGRDAAQHAAGRHGAAEAHGAEDEPHGVHHARHAARRHQLGQGWGCWSVGWCCRSRSSWYL